MTGKSRDQRARFSSFARSLITGWALLGGVVLLLVIIMNVVSVVGAAIWKPFVGDFEMTEVGIAIAVFAFLPYCQLTGSNVTADIFTARVPVRWVSMFSFVAALVALTFSLLLLWRMWYGLLDQKEYGYTTTVLAFPHWVAFVPILISLFLLAISAVLTSAENFTIMRKTGANG